MGISIQHNMLMMNADRMMRANTLKKTKSTEKLSSGYRINRAADDAAGLAMSEKMRWMVRGLNKGTENAQDGVSWVQTGDGSLEEAHAILHRMTQLAVKASNGTNSDADRALMQVEFDQLQKELDRLTDATQFNEQHIFNEHETPYYQIEGNTRWPQEMIHTVRAGENDLVVTYRQKESDPPKTASITVPAGNYTTRELMDEIDTALSDAGVSKDGLVFEYTQAGTCNLNLEGGEKIDEVSGGLSYLLFDNYGGGTLGALIGTTVYANNNKAFIQVQDGVNDYLTFKAISADGSEERKIEIDLDTGKYTKDKLMQILDEKLRAELDSDNTGKKVEVSHHGTGIMLSSPDYIITEFKGNMFEIDNDTRTGVFYDNVQHSHVKREPAVFMGGCVLYDSEPPYNNGDPEKQVLHIQRGVNNLLVLNPNGGGEITIDLMDIDGSGKSMDGCTMRELAVALNDVLQPKGLNVGVYTYPEPGAVPEYVREQDISGVWRNVRYVGLEITSQEIGIDSKVGINRTKSTAYATLFTSKQTMQYRNDAEFGGNDTQFDGNAYLRGMANVNDLEIKASGDGQNNEFMIQISSDPAVKIQLDPKKYSNAQKLAEDIQKKLEDAGYGDDVIKVSANGSGIRLDGVKTDVTKIRVSAVAGNNGYQDIFQKLDFIPDQRDKTDTKPSITLPDKAKVNGDGTVYIDPAYSNLTVYIDGTARTVNVAANNALHLWNSVADLEKYITDALKPTSTDIGCSLSIVQHGASQSNTVSKGTPQAGDVVSNPPSTSYQNKKGVTQTTLGQGGSLQYLRNDPAKVTFAAGINASGSAPLKITDANKRFSFNLNGTSYTIDLSKDLDGKTEFTSAVDFKNALQKAINTKLNKQPTEYGGIQVGLSGSSLTLTAGLMDNGVEMSGQDDTFLSMDITAGSFIYDLHETKIPASIELKGSTKGVTGFNASSASTLKVTVGKPGGASEDITLNLGTSYNNGSAIVNDLNTQLQGKNVRVQLTSEGLRFVTTGDWTGKGYSITVDENSSAVKNLFGYNQQDNPATPGVYEMTKNNPAISRTNQKVKTGFQLDAGDEQKFSLTVDGTKYDVNLAATTYNSAADIAKEIQDKVNQKAGKDVVKVTANTSGQLVFETVSKGPSSGIGLSYNANSSMKKIFGTTPVAGAEASITNDGQLTLNRIGGASDYGSIKVVSHDQYDVYRGGSFIKEKGRDYSSPEYDDGYHSTLHSYMDGVDLKLSGGKVEINEWNNELNFYYTDNYRGSGATSASQVHGIRIKVPEGNYTMKELKEKLQEQLDGWTDTNGWAAKDQFVVSVTAKGVRIEAKNAGRKYRIYTKDEIDYPDRNYKPSGSFYEKILCNSGVKEQVLSVYSKDGSQGGDKVFAVGRHDVKNNEVRIQKDGNDTLSLEFSTPDRDATNPYKLQMTLDPGYYKGDALVKQIQKKLDEALKKEGLPAGLIEAVIGIDDTGVLGAIDDRALAFRLSDKVAVEEDGLYGIEAIGGTAAFSVFYATEGDIARAYIMGGKDISGTTTIKPGATDFSADVDGTTYKINLTPGKYTAEELTEHMTKLFEEAGCPLRAVEDGGKLKLMHTQYGKHKISNLNGAVKNQLFFLENSEKVEKNIGLRLSSVSGDRVEIKKPWMNTVSLGVNTILISKYKYAQKAIGRLKEAVTKVGDVRSYFGATQNRLESTIRNNENKAENTAAAESRIRDADFSKEVMENTLHNILEQAGASMMAQTKQNAQLALQMLS